jgi:hypothetical protein
MYLLRKLYEKHKRTGWAKCSVLMLPQVVLIVILGLQWSFKRQVGNKALTLEQQMGTAHTTRFNIKNPTFCPIVLLRFYGTYNKQRLFLYTALIDRFS